MVTIPVKVADSRSRILACGAEQKASFCLSKGSYVFPSQHIGDLKNFETLENYTGQIKHCQRLFDIRPQAVVCDLHPDYMSTEYASAIAEEESLPLIKVQHHHAHIASVMAEAIAAGQLTTDARVLGIAFDGTGAGIQIFNPEYGATILVLPFGGFLTLGVLIAAMQYALKKSAKKKQLAEEAAAAEKKEEDE